MKKILLFFIITCIYTTSNAQGNCMDAYSDVNYAYSHIKKAYQANNTSHLKEYSHRSLESFKAAKDQLNTCGCDKAYSSSYDAIELLVKVEPSGTFEDARFYVKRARDLAKKVMNELELCTATENEDSDKGEDNTLIQLQNEQQELEVLRAKLKQKEADIKQQVSAREAQVLALKRQEFITKNDSAIATNIKAYNAILSACECDSKIQQSSYDKEVFNNKDMKTIKNEYLAISKRLTSAYLSKLNNCISE